MTFMTRVLFNCCKQDVHVLMVERLDKACDVMVHLKCNLTTKHKACSLIVMFLQTA